MPSREMLKSETPAATQDLENLPVQSTTLAMPSRETMILLEKSTMPSCETMILEHAEIPLEKPTMPSREMIILENAGIPLEKLTMLSCKTMISAHVEIPPAQDKAQAMPS